MSLHSEPIDHPPRHGALNFPYPQNTTLSYLRTSSPPLFPRKEIGGGSITSLHLSFVKEKKKKGRDISCSPEKLLKNFAMASCRGALHRWPLRLPLSLSFVPASRISSLSRHSPPVPRFQINGMHSEPKLKGATQQKEQLSNKWKIKMLYDGECPFCMREVNMLRERNQAYGTIKFVDISSDNFSSAENQGLDYKTVMGRIHAIQSDGTVYTDVEAFRRLYEEVGLGWVYVITKYEPISTIANVIYKIWATYRLQLTGRPSLEKIIELKKNAMGETCNDGKVCKM